MKRFLLHGGMTLVRSFEAGTRTSMMHGMRGEDPLATLVSETIKEPTLAYIKVINEDGQILASGGNLPENDLSPSVAQVLDSADPITTLLPNNKVFEVACSFKPVSDNYKMNMMMERWQWRDNPFDSKKKVIYLGLATSEFDQARHADLRYAVILGFIVFFAGITGFYLLFVNQEIRVTKHTLADMELYTRNVIESMPAGLITLDNEGRIVSCNTKAENITGKTFAQLERKKLADELPSFPVLSPEHSQLLDESFEYKHGDITIPVKVSSSNLISTDGMITGIVLIFRDVREIHEMEQKLELSRRLAALGRMAAGIAHEIRNPLGTIRGFAQFFRNAFADQPTEKEYATLMIGEVDRLNRIVSGLLQFAKPRKPEFNKLQLHSLLKKAEKLLGDDCKSKEIMLNVALPVAGTTLTADPDLVLQVIINLLKNSIEASEQGGEINLKTDVYDESVVLWIEDKGKGMSVEQRSRMFDPFYTTRKEGIGLGLAIVHQIMQQHNGSIDVSSNEGSGTKILLTFPLKMKEFHDEHA